MPTANNDWVIGTAGDDTLDGGAGADTMVGGTGNDIYYVDNAGDIVGENSGEGKDTVYASVSHVLGANVENLVLSGTADWANGNNLDNAITGNAIANVLWGGEGNDTLTGGAGNDSYFVDSFGDVVAELADEGIDTLYSSISIPSEAPLTANVENLVLMGTAILGYGNALNNHITGNDSNNHLDGWGGIDTLEGGLGSDTYTVYTAGTVVIETANSGDYDTIYVAGPISYTLPDHVEQLALLMTGGALNGTGNGLNNTIVGNENANDLAGLAGDDVLYGNDGNDILNAGVGNDTLDGGVGRDTMSGGAGNDTYYVNNAADLTIEQGVGGTDVVYSSINWTLGTNVEKLVIIDSAVRAAGNALNNVIQGNSGDNIIRGGSGADTLTGAGGEDQFEIAATDSGRDTITDFAPGLDLFVLSGFGLDPIQEGYNFMIDAGPVGDYATLLYSTTTGILSYDEDGTGGVASREIALLSTKPTLTSADFFVY